MAARRYLLAVLLCLFYDDTIQSPNITVSPISINATLNSTVIFTCEVIADDITFFVDGIQATNNIIKNRGFTQRFTLGIDTVTGLLNATAYENNNGTSIQCRAVINYPFQIKYSPTAVLLIQGTLTSVTNLNYVFLNCTSIQLTWIPPYTLNNVPITGYYIDINTTVNDTSTIITLTDTDPCSLTTISVYPVNGVGMGQPNNVTFQHQTVPEAELTPDTSVTMLSVSLIQITVNISGLCPGHYPTIISVDILHLNNVLTRQTHLFTDTLDDKQLIIRNISTDNSLITFNVSVSLSNRGGIFPVIEPFSFGTSNNSLTLPITSTSQSINSTVLITSHSTSTINSSTVPFSFTNEPLNCTATKTKVLGITVTSSVLNSNVSSIDKSNLLWQPVVIIATIGTLSAVVTVLLLLLACIGLSMCNIYWRKKGVTIASPVLTQSNTSYGQITPTLNNNPAYGNITQSSTNINPAYGQITGEDTKNTIIYEDVII